MAFSDVHFWCIWHWLFRRIQSRDVWLQVLAWNMSSGTTISQPLILQADFGFWMRPQSGLESSTPCEEVFYRVSRFTKESFSFLQNGSAVNMKVHFLPIELEPHCAFHISKHSSPNAKVSAICDIGKEHWIKRESAFRLFTHGDFWWSKNMTTEIKKHLNEKSLIFTACLFGSVIHAAKNEMWG